MLEIYDPLSQPQGVLQLLLTWWHTWNTSSNSSTTRRSICMVFVLWLGKTSEILFLVSVTLLLCLSKLFQRKGNIYIFIVTLWHDLLVVITNMFFSFNEKSNICSQIRPICWMRYVQPIWPIQKLTWCGQSGAIWKICSAGDQHTHQYTFYGWKLKLNIRLSFKGNRSWRDREHQYSGKSSPSVYYYFMWCNIVCRQQLWRNVLYFMNVTSKRAEGERKEVDSLVGAEYGGMLTWIQCVTSLFKVLFMLHLVLFANSLPQPVGNSWDNVST